MQKGKMRIFKLIFVATLILILVLLCSCEKGTNTQQVPIEYLTVTDRDEAMVRFGSNALYPPEGFADNIYKFSYAYYNVPKVQEGELDPYIQTYMIQEYQDEQHVNNIFCMRGEQEIKIVSDEEMTNEQQDGAQTGSVEIRGVNVMYIYEEGKELTLKFNFLGNHYRLTRVCLNMTVDTENIMEDSWVQLAKQMLDAYYQN